MVKNLMPEVAKMLGVEMKEAFHLENCGDTLFALNEHGLLYYNNILNVWQSASGEFLSDILKGIYEIKKQPWKPKANEDYFYVGWIYDGEHWRFCIETTYFDATETSDNLNVDIGNCFRTHEEAEAAQFDIFERLTGKKWEEVHGKAGEAE